MLELKNVLGLCCAALGLFVCLLFRNTMYQDSALNAINDKIFDSALITLGDYSVKGKISSKQYKAFL